MVVLYVYLGSIVITVLASELTDKYIDKEIENRGYEYANQKKNIYGNIINYMISFLLCSIPVINLIFAAFNIFKAEDLSKETIKEFISDGTIVKKKEEPELKEEPKLIEASEIDESLVENSKIIVYRVESNEKKQMSREEKIEFLKQEYCRLTGEELNNRTKGKGRQKRR